MGLAPEHAVHPFAPVWDVHCRVLVLGSFPSVRSREIGFYYGHPQNRFWRVLERLYGQPVPPDTAGRRSFVLRHGLALWDVLAACDIEGASDASIAHAVPNDLRVIIDHAPIAKVFTTGSKAAALYRRLCAPGLPDLPHTALPSTSPANARMRLADLVEAYAPIKDALAGR